MAFYWNSNANAVGGAEHSTERRCPDVSAETHINSDSRYAL
jgi:hypothetical protein